MWKVCISRNPGVFNIYREYLHQYYVCLDQAIEYDISVEVRTYDDKWVKTQMSGYSNHSKSKNIKMETYKNKNA